MFRLNCCITEEAHQYLKAAGKKMGCSMGTVVTIMTLEKMREDNAFNTVSLVQKLMKDSGSDILKEISTETDSQNG